MICSIDGCGRDTYRRGWCCAHYNRWRRNGSTDGQRVMYGEPLAYVHETVISYRGDDCLIWPFSKNTEGYAHVKSGGNLVLVHRISCVAAHGSPPSTSHQAAHSCGNGHLGCVNPKHLRWATPKENCADKRMHPPRQFRSVEAVCNA